MIFNYKGMFEIIFKNNDVLCNLNIIYQVIKHDSNFNRCTGCSALPSPILGQ